MRLLIPYMAVVLVYMMTPMAAEVTENVVHLLRAGHLAHALPDAQHQPDGDEHGCSPTFHVCGSQAAGFVLTETGCVLVRAQLECARALGPSGQPLEGHLRRLHRPPKLA